ECGAEPPYAFPTCPTGDRVIAAACTRGSDGTCAWHPPTCGPCLEVVCPELCPVNTAMVSYAATASTCGTCGCTPVATQ
ncbi:MAG TPA: hypothetical protein VLA14_05450, partial [Polyangia bacterium]|nr:hypothetical protein [Polyangia bacterium]